jgi:hypothetical protein
MRSSRLLIRLQTGFVALSALISGCSADDPINPSFPLTMADAKAAMEAMREMPKPLARPLVVLGGIHDPGIVSAGLAKRLGKTVQGGPIIDVAFFGADTFDACRDRVIAKVQRVAPSERPGETVEVDVVGISMGGLVARHAARPREGDGMRLRINRLFTIAAPHAGAKLATLPTFDRRQIDMRRGSAFLTSLDVGLDGVDYEIVPYVRLGDGIVGEQNAAPPGRRAWWVANPPMSLSHISASEDPRIVADIARRLRGETPYTIEPPAAVP